MGKFDKYTKLLEERHGDNIRIISKRWNKNGVKFQCKKGHIFKLTEEEFLNNKLCDICKNKKRKKNIDVVLDNGNNNDDNNIYDHIGKIASFLVKSSVKLINDSLKEFKTK
jgi:hypothetical protein